LHSSPTWYGIAVGAWGAGMLVGAVGGSRFVSSDLSLVHTMLLAVVGLSFAVIGIALCQNVGQLIVLSVVGGVANALVNLAGTTLLSRRPPPEVRGRVAAVCSGVLSASLIGAYGIGGVAAVFLTPREVYAGGGLLGLLAPALLGRVLLRAVRAEAPARVQAEAGRLSQSA
jgi:MFS family permease